MTTNFLWPVIKGLAFVKVPVYAVEVTLIGKLAKDPWSIVKLQVVVETVPDAGVAPDVSSTMAIAGEKVLPIVI